MSKEIIFILIIFKIHTLLGQESDIMTSFTQPYCNMQLNSYLNINTNAKGEIDYRIPLRKYGGPVRRERIFFINDENLILEKEGVSLLVNIKKKEVIKGWKIHNNAFLFKDDESKIYNINSRELIIIDPFSIKEKRIKQNLFLFFGGEPELNLISLKDNKLICGVDINHFPYEGKASDRFILTAYNYNDFNKIGQIEYNFSLPFLLPVSSDYKIFIPGNSFIDVINDQCKLLRKIPIEFTVLKMSIGCDNLLYIFGLEGNKRYLICMDYEGNTKWKKETKLTSLNQPPAISKNSIVYLIGRICKKSKIVAFKEGIKKWEYEISSTFADQPATVLKNDNLLIADDNKVLYLSKSGKPIWIYEHKTNLPFISPPVIGPQGRVVVANSEEIIFLK